MKRVLFSIVIIIMVLTSCRDSKPSNDVYKEYLYYLKYGTYDGITVNDSICSDIELVMKNHKLPYGVGIVADCGTGEIIGIAEFSNRKYKKGEYINKPLEATSIFKIVTLAAAIGSGTYKPDSKIAYYGSRYSELKNYSKTRKNTKLRNYTTVMRASAMSNNPAFGEIGMNVGYARIAEYAKKFLFTNTQIRGINTGYIDSTEGNDELARLSSGLQYSHMSPFHALMIAMSLGNEGVLVYPRMDKSDKKGETRIISKTTTEKILESMSKTVVYGTSSGIFKKDKYVSSGTFAKTGSLYETDPPGHHNWFVAVYKGEKTNYAIVALTVNDPIWEIKASYMGLKIIQFVRKYEEN